MNRLLAAALAAAVAALAGCAALKGKGYSGRAGGDLELGRQDLDDAKAEFSHYPD